MTAQVNTRAGRLPYQRGSEWRKWDLHIHTLGTGREDKFTGWPSFLQALKATKDVSVVGVTDYVSIENYDRRRFETAACQDPNRLSAPSFSQRTQRYQRFLGKFQQKTDQRWYIIGAIFAHYTCPITKHRVPRHATNRQGPRCKFAPAHRSHPSRHIATKSITRSHASRSSTSGNHILVPGPESLN